MAVAAIYARYSSDSQRDESIEIQVEQCSALIGREGWEQGEVYADYAKTGTNDNRPAFRRCIADGRAGLFDVLVMYKTDRFARNVEVSRKYKRELRDAGVRIVSVREGEMRDTPDGMLGEGVAELFAEYYSRNLSVLIRNGVRKSAEKHLAAGVRVFGYRTGADGRFEVNEREAEVVREVFASYLAGDSVPRIAERMNREGVRTTRGNAWCTQTVSKMLRNESYAGTYRYAGVVAPGGMPAIVSMEDFLMVQDEMGSRKAAGKARRRNDADFPLTGKLFSLIDGKPMGGSSGTAKSGRKYCYYKVREAGGLSVPKDVIESAVTEKVLSSLREDGSVDRMAETLVRGTNAKPDAMREEEDELADVKRRTANIVKAIEDGGSARALNEALLSLQERQYELEYAIAQHEYRMMHAADPEKAVELVRRIAELFSSSDGWSEDAVAAFAHRIYTDGEVAVIVLDLGDGGKEFDLGTIRSIAKGELPDEPGVRLCKLWWR